MGEPFRVVGGTMKFKTILNLSIILLMTYILIFHIIPTFEFTEYDNPNSNSTKPISTSTTYTKNEEPLFNELNNPITCYARGFGSLTC